MEKKYLYSPWRLDYILSKKEQDCIFCLKPAAGDDEKHLIVYRSKYCFVILNLYPYNNGHVMVVPFEHVPDISSLSDATLADIFKTVQLTESVMKNVYHNEGLNVGINIGKAAGAGVDEHIHVHIVPRWLGDCNFMSVVGGKRVIPEDFGHAYQMLKAEFDKHQQTNEV
jgi:ATP adenylyltransferase